MKKHLHIKQFISWVLALSLILGNVVCGSDIDRGPTNKNYVINVILDGLGSDLFNEIKENGAQTPNLDTLIENGVRLTNVKTTIPSYGGSQAAFLTGASPNTNGYLYRYFNKDTNTVEKDAYHMKATTIFEQIKEEQPNAKVLATGWAFGNTSIDGRGVTVGDTQNTLIEKALGDKLVSIKSVTDDLVKAIMDQYPPEFMTAYSNDIKMLYWSKPADQTTIENLKATLEEIDIQLGRIINALKAKGIYEDTVIMIHSLSNVYQVGSKYTVENLIKDIETATGRQLIKEGKIEVKQMGDRPVTTPAQLTTTPAAIELQQGALVKNYITDYLQLSFIEKISKEDKDAVLDYLKTHPKIKGIYTGSELGIEDYADYIIEPVKGISFCGAGSNLFRVDSLSVDKIFCLLAGKGIDNRGIQNGEYTIEDFVPVLCKYLGVSEPAECEGTSWDFINYPPEPTYDRVSEGETGKPLGEGYVVNVIVDGLSHEMYDRIKMEFNLEIPYLDQIIENGARLSNVKTVIPSYGGSQAAFLTGASPAKNEFLYRYYDRAQNKVINNASEANKMNAETIFEKLYNEYNAKVFATGWNLAGESINGRGIFSENEDYKLIDHHAKGDALVGIEEITEDILQVLEKDEIPQLITGYSNDVKMAGWNKADATTDAKVAEIIKKIDAQLGRIIEKLGEKGISSKTTIILNSLSNVYRTESKVTTAELAKKITADVGVKAIELGGGDVSQDAKVVIIKQYIMAYAQLYFTDFATTEDKVAVLSYLRDANSNMGQNIKEVLSAEELGISKDYCDYLLNPAPGKTFCSASSGLYRVDHLDNRNVFCIVSGNRIPSGASVDGEVSIIDIVPTICTLLDMDMPKDVEGNSWVFEYIEQAPEITITTPKDNAIVYEEVIAIEGVVKPVGQLTINDESIPLEENGNFKAEVSLNKGENIITLKAINEAGQITEKQLHIMYKLREDIPDGNIVVYINWDGFAQYYLERAEAEGIIPTLSHIKNTEGVYFTNAYTHMPSITNPMQAAIASGTTPKYTNNHYRYYNKDLNEVIQESPNRLNEAETLAEAVVRQGLSVVSINQFAFEDRGTSYSDPYALYVSAPQGSEGYDGAIERFDEAIKMVRTGEVGGIKLQELPRFIALYMDDIDALGHNEKDAYGIKMATTEEGRMQNIMARMAVMDRKLGHFIEACQEVGIYDQMSFVLTADHGMAQFGMQEGIEDERTYTKLDILIEEIETLGEGFKCEALHPTTGPAKPSEGTDIALVTVGLQAQLSYIGEKDEAVIREKNSKIMEALKDEPYVGVVMQPEEMLEKGAKRGFADLIVSPKVPYNFHMTNKLRIARGQHDSLEEEAQHIASLMWGNGIKKGYTYTDHIYNTSFASTMAALLGINAPLDATGEILYNALEDSDEPKYDEVLIELDDNQVELTNMQQTDKVVVHYIAKKDNILELFINGQYIRTIFFPQTGLNIEGQKIINISLKEGDVFNLRTQVGQNNESIQFNKISLYVPVPIPVLPPDKEESESNGESSNNSSKEKVDNKDTNQGKIIYKDIEEVIWAKEALEKLVIKGIFEGYEDHTIRPRAYITRGEFSKIIVKAFDLGQEALENPLTDIDEQDWCYQYVNTLYHRAIIKGYGDKAFRPECFITREEATVILARVLDYLSIQLPIEKEEILKDYDEIAHYAKESVSVLYMSNIIKGTSEGVFMPKKMLTRAEIAVMIDRVLELDR
ncbi:MAG: alkaline phosphatase family protein [Cellulosilyticum sp.]|nr:alkaline phosphatase family protein [Cellulosilyticum sp.]